MFYGYKKGLHRVNNIIDNCARDSHTTNYE